MTKLHAIALCCAAVLLIVSLVSARRAESRRPFAPWPSDAERIRRHLFAITTALWAIIALLVSNAL